MIRGRHEQDELDHDTGQGRWAQVSIREVKCDVCKDVFEGEDEFHYINPLDDCDGVCDECAKDDDIREEWGFNLTNEH